MHPHIKLGSTQRPNDAARVVVFAGFLFAGVVGHNVIMLIHKKRFSHRGVKLPDSLLKRTPVYALAILNDRDWSSKEVASI
jgi:hypothetical protein